MAEILVSEAAQRAELSEYHIRRLLKAKTVTGRKVDSPRGPYWVVDVASLDEYIHDWRKRKPGAKRESKDKEDPAA